MSAKLETAENVLEWACITAQDQDWCACSRCVNIRADRATAAEIARALKLLRAFREFQAVSPRLIEGFPVLAALAAALKDSPTR